MSTNSGPTLILCPIRFRFPFHVSPLPRLFCNITKTYKTTHSSNNSFSHSQYSNYSKPHNSYSTPLYTFSLYSSYPIANTSTRCIMSSSKFVARGLWPDGSISSDKSDVSNAFGYQLGRLPESGLSFLGKNRYEEDRNDPLYYNWADIDSYEDVDDMYRSSDSTHDLGTRNGDGWFSISDAQKVPCSGSKSRKRILENNDPSRLDCVMHSSNESELHESSEIYNRSPSPSNNYGYMQGDTPYLCSVYGSSSDMTSMDQTLNPIQSESISLTTLSLHELYASDDTSDQMYQHQLLEASSDDNPTQSECNGNVNISMDGSREQQNSESFKQDDVSAGATSFRQLQHVMNQLDPRTKLCIRDSLYRLAWGAEQRNYYESFQRGFTDNRSSMFGKGTNMNMEMETDTNPIDRSIAHLLFHQGADSSAVDGEESLAF